jgi:hypothetical protein
MGREEDGKAGPVNEVGEYNETRKVTKRLRWSMEHGKERIGIYWAGKVRNKATMDMEGGKRVRWDRERDGRG